MAEIAERYRVGYAILPKKEQSFIQKSLLDHAKQRGIDLDRIDISKPLTEQGSFDCIIHKVYGDDWRKQLEEFSLKNPDVTIVDPPDSIERLHNRITMLEVVNGIEIPQRKEELGIPKQIVVYEDDVLLGPEALGELHFPVVAKPVVSDGSATSHQMYLVFSSGGLKELSTPIVLQEFVNHGGVIFKVYVVGDSVTCVKRKSLADISEEKLKTLEGALSFSQVSNLTAQDRDNSSDIDRLNVQNAEMPPVGFIVDVANALREALGLQLFNFDVIKDGREENRYLVIDINYFPGFAKMPSYESVLTDFFWDIVQKKKRLMKNKNKELAHSSASKE